MKRLAIAAVGLAVVVALAACTRTVEKVVVVTPTTPAGTPTLTVEESAYLEAVATAEKEATAVALVHKRETVAAMPTSTPRPTQTPKVAVFRGMGSKETPSFTIQSSSFTVKTTVSLDEISTLVVFVERLDGSSTAMPISFSRSGSDVAAVHDGPGEFYFMVACYYVCDWTIEVLEGD
jgi:hypothetical protein